ncbi:hypothetical protein I3842_03G168500 [Carya illinoinensis]|uniref:CCHC-type domain-containing protein n=1 Tax=Carya illinoinensis TaxID=32201 RepID=A0A922FL44_CARIL|nr:hypothetical protein I3842_03G168500 [Carya illinoinensis]
MCGKNHGGKCKLTLGLCFGCGELDHVIKNCPKRAQRKGIVPNRDFKPKPRPPVPARVYAVTPRETDTNAPRAYRSNSIPVLDSYRRASYHHSFAAPGMLVWSKKMATIFVEK